MHSLSSILSDRPVVRALSWLVFFAVGLPLVLLAIIFLLQLELNLTASKKAVAGLADWVIDGEVQIDGDVYLALGGNPALTLSGLRVAKRDGNTTAVYTAERLFVRANLGALFGGRVKAVDLVLTDAEATVARLSGDEGMFPADRWANFASVLKRRRLIPDRMNIEVTNTRIFFADERRGAASNLRLVSGKAARSAPDLPLELYLTGTWNDLPLNLSGSMRASPDAAEQDEGQSSIAMQFLGVDAKVSGKIGGSSADEPLLDLGLEAQSKDLSAWRRVLGMQSLPVQQANLQARLKSDGGQLTLEKINAGLDRTTISGDLSLQAGWHRPLLNAKLRVSDLDAGKWRRSLMSRSGGAGADVFEWLASLPVPAPLDATVSVEGSNILQSSGRKRNLTIDFILDDQTFELAVVEGQVAKAGFEALLQKKRRDGGFDHRFVLRDPKIDLAALVTGSKLDGKIEGDMATNVELNSRGISAGEIRSALNGRVDLLMGAGKGDVAALDQLVGGLTQAAGEVFSEKSKLAVINCAAVDATLHGGMMTINLGLVDTDYSTVLVSGKANLANGMLDLDVIPRKKALSLSVAPEVFITGSLQEPRYEIKKGSLLLSLGELIANVAYPDSLLVGVLDEVAGQNPCVKMLTNDKPAAGDPADTKRVEGIPETD